jgi:ABC-type sugar transport system ATPase subunit
VSARRQGSNGAGARPASQPMTLPATYSGNKAGSVSLRGAVKKHGALTVLHAIDLDIRAGEFFVLLGPSGSGKTTTLRVLAGLESLNAGEVLMDHVDVTLREPGERDVAMVFQSYALYPHMSVAQNIGFPLRMIGTAPTQIAHAVQAAAAKVGIGHLLERRPGQLSGGQQQRVALARAIVRQPRLFLLDEPLSNLDAKLRLETRLELKKLQRSLGVTTVYVTHDQEEAMTLADRIAVFMDGRIAQIGTPREVFGKPLHASVAGFIGTPPMNLLEGVWQGHQVVLGDGAAWTVSDTIAAARKVTVGVRPGDLRLAEPGIAARVELIEELGDARVLDLRIGTQALKLKGDVHANLHEGETVHLAVAPNAIHLFDRESGARVL